MNPIGNNPGVPRKLNDELTKEACRLLANGNYVSVICEYLGITKNSWYKWIRDGETAKDKFERWGELTELEEAQMKFAMKTTRAKAKAIIKNVSIIQDAAEVTWQAAAWWLERTRSDLYAPSQKITMVEENEPLTPVDVRNKLKELKQRSESKIEATEESNEAE